MMRKLLFLIILLLLNGHIFGQDLHLVEREIVKLFITAEYYPYSSRNAVKKDGTIEDSAFQARFLEITNTVPGTLIYPFDSLKLMSPYLPSGSIFNSNYSLTRIYCLRARDYFQYKFGTGVKSILLPVEPGTLNMRRGYRNLYSFSYKNKSYYLAIYLLGTGEGVKILSINSKGTVDTLPLFKTSTGMKNKIFYGAQNWQDNPNGYIYFERTNLTLYMPVTDDNGNWTSKPEAYRFTGKFFKKAEK